MVARGDHSGRGGSRRHSRHSPATLGSSDPHTLEAAAAAAIAQFELAREDGSLNRIERAYPQIKSAHEQAAAALDAHDPLVLTLEAQANLAIAELDSARASYQPELASAAVTRLATAYDRVRVGLGAQHPLAALLDASLQFGRGLTDHGLQQNGVLGSHTGTAGLPTIGATAGHWGMDREYLSPERAIDELATRDEPAQAPPVNPRQPSVHRRERNPTASSARSSCLSQTPSSVA